MKTLQEFIDNGITIKNRFGEIIDTYLSIAIGRIVFPNGHYVIIARSCDQNNSTSSVGIFDYDGNHDISITKYFNINNNGYIICNDEEELCLVLSTISSC